VEITLRARGVPVTANQPAAGPQFERWASDYQILDNPCRPTTTALMLFRDLTIEATYNAVSAKERSGSIRGRNGRRVVGGAFD
jgi:hypothetical protein